MADNVAISAGSGTSIATDDVSSVHYQKVKLDAGGDGVSVPVVAGQQTMAASVPVVVASDQGDLKVTLDSEAVVLGAGSAAIGKLGANSGVDIGDVDVLSSALPTGAATSAKQDSQTALLAGGLPAALAANGGLKVAGVAGGTVIPVSDGGGSLTVDGTVAVTVASTDDVITVTLSLDTSAYATGDVLAETQALAGAVVTNGGKAILQSLAVIDQDDQKMAMDIVILSANVSLGTENSAASISDENALNIIGAIPVLSSDYLDYGGVSVATIRNIGLVIETPADSTSLYIGAVARGAGTYSANGVTLRVGLLSRS